MNRAQAQIEIRELTPIEMVLSVADYFDSLASEVVVGSSDAERETYECSVAFGKVCWSLASDLRLAIGKYEDAVLAHLNTNCRGH